MTNIPLSSFYERCDMGNGGPVRAGRQEENLRQEFLSGVSARSFRQEGCNDVKMDEEDLVEEKSADLDWRM